jgi:dTDP-4-dehydrorhamnose 3,5-epimerase
MLEAAKDRSTVTADGREIAPRISGVTVRFAVTHVDGRGELCEIYNPAWKLHEAPLVYVYQSSVRPGMVKGWVYHKEQDDRIFVSFGRLKVVLYDPREDSPTKGMINEICLTERNRGLLIIPRLVLHAIENIGQSEAMFVNMPTRPYNHADPDKFRIALDSPQIPYVFRSGVGC